MEVRHVKTIDAVDYASSIISASGEFDISWKWYGALLYVENGYKNDGTDGKGSHSICQMQVSTAKIVAKELGDNPKLINEKWMRNNPETMIRYGAKHFRDLLDQFKGPNQYYWATRAYNAGSTRIHKAKKGSRKWRTISEKYYYNVYKRYLEINKYFLEKEN